MLGLDVAGARPLMLLSVLVGGCYEAFDELFSVGPLSLRADYQGSQNYRGSTLG